MASEVVNEAKLILVGNGEVGKTSLVNRLVHDRFENTEITLGIEITPWECSDLTLNIWDFGGQEIMHSTHQLFLTQKSIYLLVLNGRKDFHSADEDAEYWLNLINDLGDTSPIIIIFNKIDIFPCDVNKENLRQKFPNIRDFIETDCRSGNGIDYLQRAVNDLGVQLLGQYPPQSPQTWLRVKDQLNSRREPYLSERDFRDICKECQIGDRREREELTIWLNTLGVGVNYSVIDSDIMTNNIHILNPNWITKGIYKIVTSKKLRNNNGELTLVDAIDILDDKYGKDETRFLINLMEKFKLCFSLPGQTPETFLVPDLLDVSYSGYEELNQSFPEYECLNLQYHYKPRIQAGLIPKFITETSHLSRDQPRWRNGVVLQPDEYENTSALINAVNKREIEIRIRGLRRYYRKEVLTIVREYFNKLHNTFGSEVDEMVPVPGRSGEFVSYKYLRNLYDDGDETTTISLRDKTPFKIDVRRAMTGVDTTMPTTDDENDRSSLKVFISYSHEDEERLEILKKIQDQLSPIIQGEREIEVWSDTHIATGQRWSEEIKNAIESADVALFLVSGSFLASSYIMEREVPILLERAETHGTRIMSIILHDCPYDDTPLKDYQFLNQPKKGFFEDMNFTKQQALLNKLRKEIKKSVIAE